MIIRPTEGDYQGPLVPYHRDEIGSHQVDWVRMTLADLSQYQGYEDEEGSWAYGSYETRTASAKALHRGDVLPATWTAFEELRAQVKPKLQAKLKYAPSAHRRRRFREEGDDLDIDRLLGSEPCHWARMERGRKQRTIHLGINYTISAAADESTFTAMGAVSAVVAEGLEKLGLGVKISLLVGGSQSSPGHGNPKRSWILCTLKEPGRRVDRRRVLSLGQCAVLREHGHSLQKRLFGCRYAGWQIAPMNEDERKHFGIDYTIGAEAGADPVIYTDDLLTQVLKGD